MLYVVGWKYSDCIYLVLGLTLIVISIHFFKTQRHIKHSVNGRVGNQAYFFGLITVLLCVMLSLICILGLGQKIYCMVSYRLGNYETVEGSVQNLKPIYANNSNNVRGMSFEVDDVSFELNRGIINSGYSFDDGVIQNNDFVKIYYLIPNVGDNVNLILRIDSLQEP